MGTPAYSIKTERLLIRCYDPKDVYLLKSAIDESIEYLKPWLEWTKSEPEDIEKKIERIRENRANFDLGKNYVYGMFTPDNSKLIGVIGLMKRIGNNALEIGYWLHVNHTNLGYATEAASALIRIAFEVENVERVEIHCDLRNKRSAAIPERLGFVLEAVTRENERLSNGDHKMRMIWVLFKDEYKNSKLAAFPIEAFDVVGMKINWD